jgi:hypothetical protein
MKAKTRAVKWGARTARRVPGKRRAARKGVKGGLRMARRDARVQTVLHDEKVHERLRTAASNARIVYLRATRRGSAADALLEDRKGRKAVRRMFEALADALGSVRAAKAQRRRRRARYVVPIVVAGGAGVLAAREDVRERVLAMAPGSHDGAEAGSAYAAG